MQNLGLEDDILILTANDESLKPQKEILLTSCLALLDFAFFVCF